MRILIGFEFFTFCSALIWLGLVSPLCCFSGKPHYSWSSLDLMSHYFVLKTSRQILSSSSSKSWGQVC